MVYFIIWCLFGLVCAMVAGNKNRHAFGWFLLGVILGPFGLIIILILPKLNPETGLAEGEEPPATWDCHKCGALNQDPDTACYSCDAPKAPATVPCPMCKEDIKPGALKCKHCGEVFESPVGA